MQEFTIDNEYKLIWNSKSKLWDTYQFDKLLSKSADKLFKYYPLNLNSVDCLLRNYFYLSNPANFNDPFDCNVNLVEDIEDTSDMETVKRNSYTNIGVCSYSETINNHLMWAHYTNNYLGFALEFKGDNINVNIDHEKILRYTLARIIYPENPVKIKKDYKFAEHYVLTTKFKHWQYEKEWRVLAQLLSDDREIEFNTESVKGIYIGHRVPDENDSAYQMLLEIQEIKYPKVPVYVVYPHPTKLELEFEKVWN